MGVRFLIRVRPKNEHVLRQLYRQYSKLRMLDVKQQLSRMVRDRRKNQNNSKGTNNNFKLATKKSRYDYPHQKIQIRRNLSRRLKATTHQNPTNTANLSHLTPKNGSVVVSETTVNNLSNSDPVRLSSDPSKNSEFSRNPDAFLFPSKGSSRGRTS